MHTIIIIPCYNEAERLDTAAFSSFMQQYPDTGFLFVDDGSTDDTLSLLHHLACNGNASVLPLQENSGKAEAVRQGLLQAFDRYPEAELLGFWDADLATPLEEIEHFKSFIQKDTLMLMGCRHKHLGCNIQRRLLRHYLGRIFATAVSLHLHLPVYDTQCGAKIMTRTLIPEIFGRKFVTRWFFDVEILRRCIAKYGRDEVINRVTEVTLSTWIDTGESKINYFRCIYDFIKLLFSKN